MGPLKILPIGFSDPLNDSHWHGDGMHVGRGVHGSTDMSIRCNLPKI